MLFLYKATDLEGKAFADSVREKRRKFAQKSKTETQINGVRELTLG